MADPFSSTIQGAVTGLGVSGGNPWGAAIGGGMGLLGGIMQGDSNKAAAEAAANAQIQSAQIAADAARFRPVGITSRFGTSNFQRDAAGNLSGAGYEVAPDIAAMREAMLSQAGTGGLGASQQANQFGQGLMGLAGGYLAQSPQEAAANWMQQQQALLQPGRDVAYANLRTGLHGSGREGLSMSQGGNLGAANPEMQAYYNALAQQDAGLAAQAQQQGMNQAQFGAGLFGTGLSTMTGGLSPMQAQLGLAGNIEQLGAGALDTGAMLGGRSAAGGAAASSALMQGGLAAARSNQQAGQWNPMATGLMGLSSNPQFTGAIGNWMGGSSVPAPSAMSQVGTNYWGGADYGQNF